MSVYWYVFHFPRFHICRVCRRRLIKLRELSVMPLVALITRGQVLNSLGLGDRNQISDDTLSVIGLAFAG